MSHRRTGFSPSWLCLAFLAADPAPAADIAVPRDHKTIQAAVDAASAGDTVTVHPGTYREAVRLRRRVTLRSAGDDTPGERGLKRAEAVIIEGPGAGAVGSAVTLADGAVLDGVTVTKVGLFDRKEYDRHHAERGENLPDERGAAGAAGNIAAVSVDGVTARVRHVIVRDNGGPGIACTSAPGRRNASLIESNICRHNMGGGIGIADGATPIVRGNRCSENLRGGIGNRASAGIIIGNECHDNVRAGIGVREGARPVIRGNKCRGNRRAGIGIRMEGTDPLVEDNDCHGNGMAGIGCRDKAAPVIRNNRCDDNELAGIGAAAGARPVIAGNRCRNNREAGIGIESGAVATVTGNECSGNARAGIGQRGDAETVLADNHVHDNKAAGIGFEDTRSGRAVLIGNRVADNATVAVGVGAGWRVRMSGNTLSRKGGLPPIVMVAAGAEADLSDNSITGEGVAGVRTEGAVRIASDRIACPNLRPAGPPQSAVWALPGSQVTLVGATLTGWRTGLTAERCAVSLLDNVVEGFARTGVRLDRVMAGSLVVGNVFRCDPSAKGVEVKGGDEPLTDGNRIEAPRPAAR